MSNKKVDFNKSRNLNVKKKERNESCDRSGDKKGRMNWDDVKMGFKKFKAKRWNSIGTWVRFFYEKIIRELREKL
jgi:hypothetical protein